MNVIRDLLNRLEWPRTTVVQRYEATDEPAIPVWRAASDGRQRFMRPQYVEVEWLRYGEGPWRFRGLTVWGQIVGSGLRGPYLIRRRKDVPQWAVEALTAPDELVPAEGSGS